MKKHITITTYLEIFIDPFEIYVRTINEQDANTLKNDFYGGKESDWNNETGRYAIKMNSLVKKYFPNIQIKMFAWSVPTCAGGVFLFIEGTKENLNDLLQKVKMNPDYYKIGNKDTIKDMINDIFC